MSENHQNGSHRAPFTTNRSQRNTPFLAPDIRLGPNFQAARWQGLSSSTSPSGIATFSGHYTNHPTPAISRTVAPGPPTNQSQILVTNRAFDRHEQAVEEEERREVPPYIPPYIRQNRLITRAPFPPQANHQEQILPPPIEPPRPISQNYRGSLTRTAALSARIPAQSNTSVWIRGLPPTLNHKTLLAQLVNTGKIYATVINAPRDPHNTCAAKVVFWTRSGVDNLLRKASRGEFVFFEVTSGERFIPTVELNRILTAAQPESNRSRVLLVTGPREVVNFENLSRFWRETIRYELEDVSVFLSSSAAAAFTRGSVNNDDNNNVDDMTTVTMRWAFGSYRLQAQSAFKKIFDVVGQRRMAGETGGMALVRVAWGADPCEPDWLGWVSSPSVQQNPDRGRS
ncbi:hypothetical protein GGS20DRAFT_162112 [Poronia punctata]|nr:hypothetical protein GGS20DRAFT_162112 [Poronia punctata]